MVRVRISDAAPSNILSKSFIRSAKMTIMIIKSVSSPIGFFDAKYNEIWLVELSFIGQNKSKHPADDNLQRSIDLFFSKKGLESLPLMDLRGTDFQVSVWHALCAIPRGSTSSYKDIAEQIGSPNASRAVGTACKLNPIPLFVPCHRVVQQDHSIGQFALGAHNKKYLLSMEALKNDHL